MFSIVLITVALCLFFIYVGNKIKKLEITEKPTGISNLGIQLVGMLRKVVLENMGPKGENYAAYVATIFLYIFVSNISGLLGLNPPTGSYSVTLSFALITWLFIQSAGIKSNGVKGYIKGFFEPVFPFVVPNFFGTMAPLISLSLRLFGNITSGAIIMGMLYSFTGWLSSLTPAGSFNFIGLFVAPVLHIYFDIFSGFLQAYIFISLTTILTSGQFSSEE